MHIAYLTFAVGITLLGGCATTRESAELQDVAQQVRATEQAFARTMADRDHQGFMSFLSEEAVFLTEEGALRGKQRVADWWQRFYREPAAPFAWKPHQVEVLDSGTLALSTGPVLGLNDRVIGTFTSIWRLEAPGTWRIVFDKGCNACPRRETTP
jgi:ketosteroid isomerase-like protein